MEREIDFHSRSFWMENADYEPGPPLAGSARADAVIVGGGFGGLWAAYHLKRADPSMEIAVVEKAVAGYGASGRNGGFAMTLVGQSLGDFLRTYGRDEGVAAHQAMVQAVDGIGRFCEEHGVDAEYEKNGVLTVSTAPWQDEGIDDDLRAAEQMGLDDFRHLDRNALGQIVNSPTYRCGHEEKSGAILNPAKLAWGLTNFLRRQGVTIYEQTAVRRIEQRHGGVTVETERGTLTAEKAVVTTNAYSARFPRFGRWVIPIYTYIVLTEPLSKEQWETIGWAGRQGIEDRMGGFHYYRPTSDGRIAWGGEVYPYHFRNGISPEYDRDEGAFRALRSSLLRAFPALSGVNFTHAWGGPVAITVRFLATFGNDRSGRIHHGIGHCGHGVTTTYLGGEILRDLALGRRTERTDLCFVRHPPVSFPPEPLRYLFVQSSLRSMRQQDVKGRAAKPPVWLQVMRGLARRRSALARSGVTKKE